jgi:hypothetical protein
MQKNKNLNMRCIFLYLFIYFIIFLLYNFLGFTNPTPLKEILSSRLVRERMYPELVSKHVHNQEFRHDV